MLACPSGTYSLGGLPACRACPRGFSCFDAGRAPVRCPPGSHSGPAANATACAPCPAGYYCPSPERANVPCAPGTYAVLGPTTNCSDCAAGYHSGQGAANCTICAAGKHSAVGAPSCSPCPAGYGCINPAVSDLPCNVRREGGQSLVIGGSSVVILEGKACNPL